LDVEVAEKAREGAEKEAGKESERLRLAALEQAKPPGSSAVTSEKPAEVAALPPAADKAAPSQAGLNRALQTELRRVGCQVAVAGDDWSATARRSMEQFNKHAKSKLDVKLASLDALDAVKAIKGRVCPMFCEHGFRLSGERCERIVCRAGFAVGDDNTCEKIAPPKPPLAKKDHPPFAQTPVAQKPAATASPEGQITCGSGGCRPVPKGCSLLTSGQHWQSAC
jgi:hypothetical protein